MRTYVGRPRKNRFHTGDRIFVEGDSADLWLEGYDTRVCTTGVIDENERVRARKIRVILDDVDGESNVTARIRMSRIRRQD